MTPTMSTPLTVHSTPRISDDEIIPVMPVSEFWSSQDLRTKKNVELANGGVFSKESIEENLPQSKSDKPRKYDDFWTLLEDTKVHENILKEEVKWSEGKPSCDLFKYL